MKRITKLKTLIFAGFMALGLGHAVLAPSVSANNCTGINCIRDGANTTQTAGPSTSLEDSIESITNILLYVLGAIAVIMLVIGGIKYTTSNGNADQIKSAKNTIMYAIIGIVVAILAFAIVRWVVGALVS